MPITAHRPQDDRLDAPRPPARGATALAPDTACRACRLSSLCAPCGQPGTSLAHAQDPVFSRRKVQAGRLVCAQGEAFVQLFAVRAGAFKSTVTLASGREQVCGFHMEGEVFALDGVATGTHASTTTALEDSQVCAIGYAPLLAQIDNDPARKGSLSSLMSSEISRAQRQMLLLGTSSAQERLAAFLLDLSQRFLAHGYSARDFNLRMSRAEIGSFLGLTLETISRTFTLFRTESALQVDNRRIRFLDLEAFKRRYDALLQVR